MLRERPSFHDLFGGDEPPPPPHLRRYSLLSARPGEELRVLLTSPNLLTCRTHYATSESKPHVTKGPCPWCAGRGVPRFKAYACCIHAITGKAAIVELTLNAVQSCPTLRDPKGTLRGQQLVLRRRGVASNAPVVARLEPPNITQSRWSLPAPFDLWAALLTIWNVNEEDIAKLTGRITDQDGDQAEGGALPC